MVIHVSSGVSAYVLAYMLGGAPVHHKAHNKVFVLVGAALLWFGWFGFNAGSAVSAGYSAGLAFTNTQLSAGTAMLAWNLLEMAFDGTVKRVVYLDADLVVLGDLSDLAAIDLGGKTVGAVMDFAIRRWGGPRTCEALKSQRQHADRSYFNAGVLVIDLDAWRRKRVRDSAVHFLFENQGRIHCWDQDALNHALGGDWCELDPRWNRMCYWERQEFPDPPFSDEVMASLSAPNIVHFTGRRKPWNDDRHEARSHFDKYVTMAGFGGHRMTWLKGRWLDMRGWVRARRRRYTLRGAVRRIKRLVLGTVVRAVVLP
jgi:hypothetical protein